MVIIGIDETAVGCIAGGLVVAATAYAETAIPPRCINKRGSTVEVKDSKCMKEEYIDAMANAICVTAITYDVLHMSSKTVDEMGGSHNAKLHGIATLAKRVAERLHISNLTIMERRARIIVDGYADLGLLLPYEGIPQADKDIWQVSAASVLAKRQQLSMMASLHRSYPRYAFNRNHGYPTKEHLERLRKYGPSPVHRRSTKPVAALLRKVKGRE